MKQVLILALVLMALFGLAVLVGRLLYWGAGLPLWACTAIVAPLFGAAVFGVSWYYTTEELR